ncbi:MAG: hypothetical protein HYV18_04530 [Gammaproteobacteria bacterium]|nr:hypothetical protein [Gammaproteobacteria bacterium]
MKRILLALGLCVGLGFAAPAPADSRSDVYVEVYPSPYWSFGWHESQWHRGYRPHWHGGPPWCAHHRVHHFHDHGHRGHRGGHYRGHRDRWDGND